MPCATAARCGTPRPLLSAVLRPAQVLREGRRELLMMSCGEVRAVHGTEALVRVDRALSGYLREWDATPADPQRRPRFFFVPDLPNPAYHAPEVLFSVLAPGSHISPHHGVTNVRLVMHLPLIVPPGADCALHLVGHGACLALCAASCRSSERRFMKWPHVGDTLERPRAAL
jgi:hypothetical protein